MFSLESSPKTLACLQVIEKNTRVRLKIVGTRVDATEIVRMPLNLRGSQSD